MDATNIQVKIGTQTDMSQILELLLENSKEVTGYSEENCKVAAESVLANPDYGFFILA